MKKLVFCLFLAMGLFMAGLPARAFETPVTDPSGRTLLQKTANSLKSYAEKFGCDNFVWGDVRGGGSVVAVQFIPKDTVDPRQYQRMVSISLYGMTGDKPTDAKVIEKLVQGLESQAAHMGEVVADKLYRSREGDETMFLEYTVAKGKPEREDIAGVFMPVSDKAYALIQLHARSIPLRPEEERAVHQLVNPRAQ